ncbi:MAG: SDR family NAD(P)-dependent oxidoreductase [Planctomycetia bacterium]|nr:SDR family NAD(P)-dependent oxidoreductase [Planctomycetia bacterium]
MGNYLVTGCAGFIASQVAEKLLRKGHRVVGWDNRNDAYDVILKEWRLEQLKKWPRFHFSPVDVVEREKVEREFQETGPFEAVIHLAARAGVRYSVENPWTYVDTNVTGTLNLLECCRRATVRKFLLASSSSVYGKVLSNTQAVAFREEEDTNRPSSPYAASKKAAEVLAHSYHHLYGLDTTILRFFTVYGPAGRPDMSVLRFVHAMAEEKPMILYGDGSQSRDFTYVTDIADGVLASLRATGYSIFNLGGDHPRTIREMIRIVSEKLGKKPHIEYRPSHPADVPSTWADIERARTQLGWAPAVSLEEGLEKTIQWYQENREWARNLKTLHEA